MNIELLFNYVYVMSLPDLIRWSIVALFGLVSAHRRFGKRIWWKPSMIAMLCIWAVSAFFVTFFSREANGDYTLSLIPFHSYLEVLHGGNREILRSNFMNVLLFFPAGILSVFLFPDNASAWRRIVLITTVFLALSLSIETLQFFFAAGHVEMDDILHNTLGAFGGCALCVLISDKKPQ